MVSSRGIFVNKESTSRLAMCKRVPYLQFFSAKRNELMTVYSLVVKDVKNCSEPFANLWVDEPIAERIRRKSGSPLRIF